MKLDSVKNKNFVITGGGTGLGKEMAKILLENKANVAIIGRRLEPLTKFASEFESQKKKGGKLFTIQGDISTKEGCEKVLQKIKTTLGNYEILINNAGVFFSGKFEDTEFSDIDKMLDTNLKGLIYFTKLSLPNIRAAKKPAIINISSIAGKVGMPFMTIYSTTKFAVAGFTEALRRELVDQVKVIGVYPSGISTGFMGEAQSKLQKSKFKFDKPDNVALRIIEGFVKGEDEIIIGDHSKSTVFWNTANKKTVDNSFRKMKTKIMSAVNGASSEKEKIFPVDKKVFKSNK